MKTALVIGAAIALGIAPANAAGTGETAVLGVNLVYSAQDATFDGPDCAAVRWSVSYTKPPGSFIQLNLRLTQAGSNQLVDATNEAVFDDDASQATLQGSLCVTEMSDVTQGAFSFGGEVEVTTEEFTEAAAALRPIPVAVTGNPSRFSALKVRATKGARPAIARGKVVAQTLTKGTLGADGVLRIERQRNGTWRKVGSSYPDQYGRFRTTLVKKVPRNATVRVVMSDCGWCTDATKTVRAR